MSTAIIWCSRFIMYDSDLRLQVACVTLGIDDSLTHSILLPLRSHPSLRSTRQSHHLVLYLKYKYYHPLFFALAV